MRSFTEWVEQIDNDDECVGTSDYLCRVYLDGLPNPLYGWAVHLDTPPQEEPHGSEVIFVEYQGRDHGEVIISDYRLRFALDRVFMWAPTDLDEAARDTRN